MEFFLKKMYDAEEKRFGFGKTYNLCLLTFHSFTICIVIFLNINENQTNFVAKSAENLCCSYFLIFQCVVLILAILASKHTSQYRSALNIPSAEDFSVNWSSIRKKSFGTRFGVNLRYFIHKVRNIANSEMSN